MNTPVFDTDGVFDIALFGGDAPLFDGVPFDLDVFDGYAPVGGFLGSLVKVWNGSAYVNGYAKYWNGSSWQPAQLKRWTGSVWENIA